MVVPFGSSFSSRSTIAAMSRATAPRSRCSTLHMTSSTGCTVAWLTTARVSPCSTVARAPTYGAITGPVGGGVCAGVVIGVTVLATTAGSSGAPTAVTGVVITSETLAADRTPISNTARQNAATVKGRRRARSTSHMVVGQRGASTAWSCMRARCPNARAHAARQVAPAAMMLDGLARSNRHAARKGFVRGRP